MHGVTMIFLFVVPMSIGAFGNYLLPMMIGARDMALPAPERALATGSSWRPGSSSTSASSAATRRRPAGSTTSRSASKDYSPGPGIDFYALGLIFNGISTTATAINFIVTDLQAAGAGHVAEPDAALLLRDARGRPSHWSSRFPPLTCALGLLEFDRLLGFHFYDVAAGGDVILWQNLFWIFGHPEVYIIILPAFGIATAIIPTFVRRHMVAFPLVALAEILVAFIGFGVWVHHMFAWAYPPRRPSTSPPPA